MPDPPPYKEHFFGRSLVGAVTVGGWFEPARGAAFGVFWLVSPDHERQHTANRDPFLDLDQFFADFQLVGSVFLFLSFYSNWYRQLPHLAGRSPSI